MRYLAYAIALFRHHVRKPNRWVFMLCDDDSRHVYPLGDQILHYADEDCVCGPRAELVTNDGDHWIYTHHSLDGREAREHV